MVVVTSEANLEQFSSPMVKGIWISVLEKARVNRVFGTLACQWVIVDSHLEVYLGKDETKQC